jgi:hypothetical protein
MEVSSLTRGPQGNLKAWWPCLNRERSLNGPTFDQKYAAIRIRVVISIAAVNARFPIGDDVRSACSNTCNEDRASAAGHVQSLVSTALEDSERRFCTV